MIIETQNGSAARTASAPGTPAARRLIVNADDFGRSRSINEAIIRAHREGILTTASLMVNEKGAAEAVQLARENPRLGVGLHLSLLCGISALPPAQIPGLVNEAGEFTNSPVGAGMRYFFRRGLRDQLRNEIRAQFDLFRRTGLRMDHVNGHLHLHLHPTIFRLLMDEAEAFGIRRLRLTRDPFRLNASIASGQWLYRFTHAGIYTVLSATARPALRTRGIRHTDRVFGLLQNARVDERFVHALLEKLPDGDSELYSHPSLDEFKHEFEALMSPRARSQIESRGIQLIRYQDL
ncbi:MAG TPA: hopanoid biosynthesis-associated protein HpnK [Verrucomicrobiae bacterium]|nr:hopanoid biosynthesis-associated protein HpnK [Verrucomicrobiae bacterium]